MFLFTALHFKASITHSLPFFSSWHSFLSMSSTDTEKTLTDYSAHWELKLNGGKGSLEIDAKGSLTNCPRVPNWQMRTRWHSTPTLIIDKRLQAVVTGTQCSNSTTKWKKAKREESWYPRSHAKQISSQRNGSPQWRLTTQCIHYRGYCSTLEPAKIRSEYTGAGNEMFRDWPPLVLCQVPLTSVSAERSNHFSPYFCFITSCMFLL